MPLSVDSLRQYLIDELLVDPGEIAGDTELFEEGMLDSMAITELLVHLETEGGFEVQPEEITLENLGSVNRMVAFAERKSADR